MTATALEVWGDPIAHSLSPRLHAAAYRLLGWDWTYGRRRVDEQGFAAELAGLSGAFRGLSLTMPLKGAAFAAARARDERSLLTGAANTLVRGDDGWLAFNTDVGGIVAALGEQGIADVGRARIVGAGATATSALIALAEMGARDVQVVARRPEAVAALAAVGERVGATVTASAFTEGPHDRRDVTVSTLPGGVDVPRPVADGLARTGGPLLDVVYGHWPTALSEAWERHGSAAQSGASMLLHQAVLQIRAFRNGGVTEPLPGEAAVVAVMRRALVGD